MKIQDIGAPKLSAPTSRAQAERAAPSQEATPQPKGDIVSTSAQRIAGQTHAEGVTEGKALEAADNVVQLLAQRPGAAFDAYGKLDGDRAMALVA